MIELDAEFISIIAFFVIVAILVIRDRKNIEFKTLLLMRKTQNGIDKIENFAKKNEKLISKFATVSVILAFLLSITGFFFLFRIPGVRFMFPKVFPGEVSEGISKVAFFIPLWYWVIALFIIIVPHELAHGVVSVVEKIKIKSMGLILLLIFPGAFVEPDEKKFKRSKPSTRMRIAAVGSIANIVVALFLVLIILSWNFLGNSVFQGVGVTFESTIPGTPADQINLKGKITQINGKEIKTAKDLAVVLGSVKPGDPVNIVTTEGVYSLNAIENPDSQGKGFIGIKSIETEFDYKPAFLFLGNSEKGVKVYQWFADLFLWTAFLDINVAIANLLPFLPFDGGVIWHALFEKITKNKKQAKKMIIFLSAFTYIILILNLIGIQNILKFLGFIS